MLWLARVTKSAIICVCHSYRGSPQCWTVMFWTKQTCSIWAVTCILFIQYLTVERETVPPIEKHVNFTPFWQRIIRLRKTLKLHNCTCTVIYYLFSLPPVSLSGMENHTNLSVCVHLWGFITGRPSPNQTWQTPDKSRHHFAAFNNTLELIIC